jgi:crotonobetainyl-CoA:carnitine CoA-transferase CaiB-like acyl-CoA transferase
MESLDGLKVIDLSTLFPGAFCTTLLADHGADVIVVEAPQKKHNRILASVPMLKRNKRHLGLDLKGPGKDIFYRLLAGADVLVEGFRPGVTERLGISYPEVAAVNPKLIYCSVTGYGQEGPLAQKASHDLNYLAVTGILDLVKTEDGIPVVPGFQMAGMAGSIYAALGILLALTARGKTGKGQHIDVSMTDGLLSLLALPLAATFSGVRLPGRDEQNSVGMLPYYRTYKTRDERFLSVGPLEPHLWQKLCSKLECPDYGKLQHDPDRAQEITGHLEKLFSSRDLNEWIEFFDSPDDCVSPVHNMGEVPEYAHFRVRNMIRFSPEGIPEAGVAPGLSLTPGSVRRAAYRFGEHSVEILQELNYSSEVIEQLKSRNIVYAAETLQGESSGVREIS